MFDNVSWGEIVIVGSIGIAITGKRDIPKVCHFVGSQLGRVVGLLQGARVRADQFTQHNELKSLQNELRSGLRELDQVKTELAIAASSSGMVGRSLGQTTMSANKKASSSSSSSSSPNVVFPPSSSFLSSTTNKNNNINNHNRIEQQQSSLQMKDFDFHINSDDSSSDDNVAATTTTGHNNDDHDHDPPNQDQNQQQQQQHKHNQEGVAAALSSSSSSLSSSHLLSPVLQTERAVMEEEWKKQGIGFRARAEQGLWIDNNNNDNNNASNNNNNDGSSSDSIITDTTRATGSELLEHIQREVLIFDQYDRVVGEQENQIKQRINRIQKERSSSSKSRSKSKSTTTK